MQPYYEDEQVIIKRVWAMPSIWTFDIPAIAVLIRKYAGEGQGWIDPFAGHHSPVEVTNDIEQATAKYHLDGLDFLRGRARDSARGALFDPPYSAEQCLRRYTPKQGGMAGKAEYWARCKDELARIIVPGGLAICFAWDSTGLGKGRGFGLVEVLLVCHGACHNDTIVTVERCRQMVMPLETP